MSRIGKTKNFQVRNKIWNQVGDQVKDQADDQTFYQIWATKQIMSRIGVKISDYFWWQVKVKANEKN